MGSRGKPDLTIRPKCNAIQGELPVLQYCSVEQLDIDETYQRSLEMAKSVTLIRRIATFWDWGLCQPLFVARRADGKLYVVDGQHRLAAARLRGDIWQLPCVVRSFTSTEEEAAAFVALNQERTPLTHLQIFKASLASGDQEAAIIVSALDAAGLRVANSSNLETSPPGSVSNVKGLRNCLRAHGEKVLIAALDVMAKSFDGQRMRYAGTLFPGIAAIVAAEIRNGPTFGGETRTLMIEMIGGADQSEWLRDLLALIAEDPNLSRGAASVLVFKTAWKDCIEAMLEEAA